MKTTRNTTKSHDNPLLCLLCLAKDDLIRITAEKERLVNSLLSIPFTKDPKSRICINCTSALTCFDKFQKNAKTAQKIFEEQSEKLPLNVLSEVDDSINAAFDTVLTWLTDVNVLLRHLPQRLESTEVVLTQVDEDPEIHFEAVEMEVEEGEVVCEVKAEEPEEITEEVKNEPLNQKNVEEDLESSFEEPEDTAAMSDDQHFDDDQDSDSFEDYFQDKVPPQSTPAQEPKSSNTEQEMEQEEIEAEEPENPADPKAMEIMANFNPDDFLDPSRLGESRRKYKCCGKNYDRKELIYHRNAHLGLKPYKCKYCSHATSSPHVLVKHMRISHNYSGPSLIVHEPEVDMSFITELRELDKYYDQTLKGSNRPYRCPNCNKTYHKIELKYHFNMHNKVRPFACTVEDCTGAFFNPYDLASHMKNYHKITPPPRQKRMMFIERFKKSNPSLSTVSYARKRTKVGRRQGGICPICGITSKKLSDHIKIHNKPDLICPYKTEDSCNEIFVKKQVLTNHIRKLHDKSYLGEFSLPLDHICEICGKELNKKNKIYHMNEHQGITPYVCDVENCGKSFSAPYKLKSHKYSEHQKIKTCNVCLMIFANQAEFEAHKEDNCNAMMVKCDFCDVEMRKDSIRRHMKTHNKINAKCEICDLEMRHESIRRHMKTHLKEKNRFCCTVKGCDKEYTMRKNLNAHYRDKHPDYKDIVNHKIQCESCDMMLHPDSIRRHRKIHLKYKSMQGNISMEDLKCLLCDKKFLVKRGLQIHMARKHPQTKKEK